MTKKNVLPNKDYNVHAILSLVFLIPIFTLPLSFAFGITAIGQIGKTKEKGKALAIFSTIFSGLGFLLSNLWVLGMIYTSIMLIGMIKFLN